MNQTQWITSRVPSYLSELQSTQWLPPNGLLHHSTHSAITLINTSWMPVHFIMPLYTSEWMNTSELLHTSLNESKYSELFHPLWITNKLTWCFHIQKWCEPVCLSIRQGLKTPNEFPVTFSFGNSTFLTHVFSLLYANCLDLPFFCLWIMLYSGLGHNTTNSWYTTIFWALRINIQT